MAFLKNAWYVASWSDAIKPGELLPRKIIGEDVVFFRDADSVDATLIAQQLHRPRIHYAAATYGRAVWRGRDSEIVDEVHAGLSITPVLGLGTGLGCDH